MHALIELIVGLVALLAAATLSPFGIDLQPAQGAEREIQRVSDCGDRAPNGAKAATNTDC